MTAKEIQAKQDLENKRFEAAKHIRAYLDDLAKQVGSVYGDDDWESSILEMVSE